MADAALTAADIPWGLRDEAPPAPAPDPETFVVDLIIENLSYRALAQAAIHQLHDLGIAHERLRAAHARDRAAYRDLCAQVRRGSVLRHGGGTTGAAA